MLSNYCANIITYSRYLLPTFASCSGRYMSCSAAEKEVVIESNSNVAVAVLNRQKALNALNTFMVEKVAETYTEWENDDSVNCIVLKGAGQKAFCSGGDVKNAVLACRNGKLDEALHFFKREFTCDWLVANLQKPHISLIDGIVMGGGTGISVNGQFTVATERTVFAMPESVIGFFADVGAGHYFNTRMPSYLGMYLALTGARLKGSDAKVAGIATHYINSQDLHKVEEALSELEKDGQDLSLVDGVLKNLEQLVQEEEGSIKQNFDVIQQCFSQNSVEDIFQALEEQQETSEFCRLTLQQLQKLSPLSLKISFAHMMQSQGKSVREVLNMDYRLAYHICKGPSDFQEGIRALLLDKDQNPKWMYPSVYQVPNDFVDEFFQPIEDELQLEEPAHTKL